jgi:DNA-binding beta-propeller fold protein YncE
MAISKKADLALVANRADNSISVLSIAGKEVKLTESVAMGDSVTAIAITPDGIVDTVAIVDLEAMPPRVIDFVVVGDGPEGLAISPKGNLAVSVLLRGGNNDKKAFFYHKNGSLAVLRVTGKKATKVDGTKLTDTGKRMKIDGHPLAMRVSPPK